MKKPAKICWLRQTMEGRRSLTLLTSKAIYFLTLVEHQALPSGSRIVVQFSNLTWLLSSERINGKTHFFLNSLLNSVTKQSWLEICFKAKFRSSKNRMSRRTTLNIFDSVAEFVKLKTKKQKKIWLNWLSKP